MMRIIVILLLFICSCEAGITRIQSKSASVNSASTVTVTFSATPTINNWVVCGITSSSPNAMKLSGSDFNSYVTTLVSPNSTGPTYEAIGIYQSLGASASVVVTQTAGTTGVIIATCVEYKAPNLMVDRATAVNTGNSTSPATATFSTGYNSELLVAMLGVRTQQSSDNTSFFSSPTNSFAIVEQHTSTNNTANGDRASAFLERIVTATVSSISAGATGTSGQWAASLVTWRELTGGSPFSVRNNPAFKGFHGTNPMMVTLRERIK